MIKLQMIRDPLIQQIRTRDTRGTDHTDILIRYHIEFLRIRFSRPLARTIYVYYYTNDLQSCQIAFLWLYFRQERNIIEIYGNGLFDDAQCPDNRNC